MDALQPDVTADRCAGRSRVRIVAAIAIASLLGSATPAHAADGCLVLLCLTAPSWSSIAQCVAPVRQVLHDLARGRPFPNCTMSSAGNGASNQWSSPPAFCPPQYTRSQDLESGIAYFCDYDGAIAVNVNGALWSRTWWSFSGGNTVTEFTPAAKTQLGTWDTRFDDDYAAWLASLPPTACATC